MPRDFSTYTAYTVFESVNMKSTRGAEFILDAIASEDIENGTFGYLNGLARNETNTYNFVKGVAAGKQVVVVDNPAWNEDTSRITNQRRDKYIIPAGTRFRVRVLAKGDVFGISILGVTSASQSAMAVNAHVTIDTSGKLVAKATTTTTADVAMEAVVERVRPVGGTLATSARDYGYKYNIYECRVVTLA